MRPVAVDQHSHSIFKADAAACGADLAAGLVGFPGFVQSHMVGHDEMRFIADAQASGAGVNTIGGEAVHLFQENKGVQDNAVAYETEFAGMQDAGRNGVQNGLLAIDLDRMSCVVAALEADHNITVGTEHVDDLALAFITPLGANDNRVCHNLNTLIVRNWPCVPPLWHNAGLVRPIANPVLRQ